MPNWIRFLIVAWLAIGSAFGFSWKDVVAVNQISATKLPNEAQETLARAKSGGPFPYSQDGAIFGNYERRLPTEFRGYYREYTVRSPWRRDRGPRRIIAGRNGEYYYTDDHYRTFRRITE